MQSFLQVLMRSHGIQRSIVLRIKKELENYKGSGNLSKPLGLLL